MCAVLCAGAVLTTHEDGAGLDHVANGCEMKCWRENGCCWRAFRQAVNQRLSEGLGLCDCTVHLPITGNKHP
jgi:hypothetical protein